MRIDMTNDELLSTTRVVRKRLDFTRPIERSVIEECLSLAVQAPTASNRQEWHWIFVTDLDTRIRLGEIYRSEEGEYRPLAFPEMAVDYVRSVHHDAVFASADFLHDHIQDAPVLLVPCHLGRVDVDGASVATQAALWGSLLPAVWSLFLALRTRGLGAAWTSIHLRNEQAAAEVLGIPHDQYTQAACSRSRIRAELTFAQRPAARSRRSSTGTSGDGLPAPRSWSWRTFAQQLDTVILDGPAAGLTVES